MSTRRFVIVALGGAMLVQSGCGADAPARPNLVLITVDRLATDRLACFGGPADAGLSVCALAEGGTLFAWAASPGRVEASGAATVLTGLPESEHGVTQVGQSFLADASTSIAEELSQAGYATAGFVASAQVNRSRRLDQGFALFDDRLASKSRTGAAQSVELPRAVHAWIETAPTPWFVWIHADRDAGLVELDRLISRLSQDLAADSNGPAILFAALRGERNFEERESIPGESKIGWRSHRIPLLFRPAPGKGATPNSISRRLASLLDVAPTLRAAAHLRAASPPSTSFSSSSSTNPELARAELTRKARSSQMRGLDLNHLSLPEDNEAKHSFGDDERFLLLTVATPHGEVGLATRNAIYVRQPSPLDGTGRPVATTSLVPLAARFAALPKSETPEGRSHDSARFEIGPWREDVLDASSPVPRLEFYLARELNHEPDADEKDQPK